jgi:hypothetical protein
VALGLIDDDEAHLIIDTRLEYQPIEEFARATGVDLDTLRRRRDRAGQRIADALVQGHLSGSVSEPVRRDLTRQAARRRAISHAVAAA